MLRLEDVQLYRNGFALRAGLEVPAGAVVAVIGPSGAGKSTLLGMIAGFLPPCAGRINWMGKDITPLPPGARPVSVIFQDNNLFPHLTAFQNVALGLRPSLRLSPEETERVRKVLARVGLAGLEDRRPAQLSGGQQSRVALARVAVAARPVALLDEPFAALGPALRHEMLALVSELAAETGLTVLIVTHDPEDARRIAPQTILVSDGIAAAPADTAGLFADPPPALRAYLGA